MIATDPLALSDSLLAQGRKSEAIATVATAADRGHAEALFRQAIWQLVGDPLPRDLVAARRKFRHLANYGHAEAQLIDVALTANGSGGPADWRDARTLLKAANPANEGANIQLELLGAMKLNDDGTPSVSHVIEDLAPGGAVRRARAFLTPAECAHVARSAADLLQPATVIDPQTGRHVPHPIRTSDAGVIGPVREDLVIRAINQRIASLSDTDISAGEALTVLRYSPGQQFRLHSDALPGSRNQRIKTVLIYLNEGFSGGDTVFPELGLSIRPRAGEAIIFTNLRSDGTPDPRTRHAGTPIVKGVKWLATRWIRESAFDVWRGPETV